MSASVFTCTAAALTAVYLFVSGTGNVDAAVALAGAIGFTGFLWTILVA